MVKITDGVNVIEVTSGASKNFLASGWRLCKETEVVQEQSKIDLEAKTNSGDIISQPDEENSKIEQENSTEEEQKSETESAEEAMAKLLEKPLGELSTEELKAVAAHFGIDHKGKTKQVVRLEIAEAMK